MLITVKVSGRDQTQAINITIESSLSELFCDTILTETVAADGLFANQCENYLVDCEMWWLIWWIFDQMPQPVFVAIKLLIFLIRIPR